MVAEVESHSRLHYIFLKKKTENKIIIKSNNYHTTFASILVMSCMYNT